MRKKDINELKLDVVFTIFYETDFKNKNCYDFWKREFQKAPAMNEKDFRKWACDMLNYLDDFSDSVYYLRGEIEILLNEII